MHLVCQSPVGVSAVLLAVFGLQLMMLSVCITASLLLRLL